MNQRFYGLFERQGKRWVRLTQMAFPLATARRIFQNALIYRRWFDPESPDGMRQTNELRLRPIKSAAASRQKAA